MNFRSPIGLVLVAVVVAIIVGAGVHFTLRPLWGADNTPGAENSSGSPSPAPGPENPLMTEHKPNALIHESSPYLLQHAYNPVDWMPWGDAAFAKAKAENKIVFLSIGYSACHWCHVMERESFENDATLSKRASIPCFPSPGRRSEHHRPLSASASYVQSSKIAAHGSQASPAFPSTGPRYIYARRWPLESGRGYPLPTPLP